MPRNRPSTLTRMLAATARRGAVGKAVAPRIEKWRVTASLHPVDDRRTARSQQAALDRSRDEVYRQIWSGAATALGAEIEEFSTGFFLIQRRGVETLVFRDQVMLDSPATTTLAGDKAVLQGLLRRSSLPVPLFEEAPSDDPSALLAFLARADGACVVKPGRGTGGGQGVTCGVHSPDELLQAWLVAAPYASSVIVEEQVTGHEFRLLFLDGELLGAVRRGIPAVVGDGRHSVRELVAALNEARAAAGPGEVGRLLDIDLDCRIALSRSHVGPSSVPDAGQAIPIKGSASQNGRDDNDTWDQFSPDLVATAARAVAVARLRLAGVDVVTPDPLDSLQDAGGVILEVNGTPGLRHHYQVRDTRTASAVAVPLLECLLSEPRPPDGRQGAGGSSAFA
jgi:cyanophycin synthetase